MITFIVGIIVGFAIYAFLRVRWMKIKRYKNRDTIEYIFHIEGKLIESLYVSTKEKTCKNEHNYNQSKCG